MNERYEGVQFGRRRFKVKPPPDFLTVWIYCSEVEASPACLICRRRRRTSWANDVKELQWPDVKKKNLSSTT